MRYPIPTAKMNHPKFLSLLTAVNYIPHPAPWDDTVLITPSTPIYVIYS